MRKLRYTLFSGLTGLLLLASQETHADDSTLDDYVKNLGAYLGYDISVDVSGPLATLLDVSNAMLTQQHAFVTLLGAIPVDAYTDALAYLSELRSHSSIWKTDTGISIFMTNCSDASVTFSMDLPAGQYPTSGSWSAYDITSGDNKYLSTTVNGYNISTGVLPYEVSVIELRQV